MTKIFEKILQGMNGELRLVTSDEDLEWNRAIYACNEIVIRELARYTDEHRETIQQLMNGEWVDSDKVENALGLSFSECFHIFDFSRTAGWWSLVGKTPEERAREGQKVETKFKIKGLGNDKNS